ncbi:Tol-Pal system protein TolQ [Gammaproteobacteria bacterium]|nr:MotA/TolQ/ExbB proton channel family protein [Gammaproteobacteria bacterium]QOJ31526.1 MAG: MotA/TolQ/ExbB proton channel family protein [Gammaproteobacteria bacterium]CAG0945018.1 Tol-Pal system protein TolQ [Gammaproteobacteria bacterium]
MVELAALALSIALAAQQPTTDAATAAPATAETTTLPAADATAPAPAEMAPAEAPVDVPAAEPAQTEEKANPYGLSQLWAQGDFVARGTLVILVVMSFASWFIILTKLWDQARLRRQFNQTDKGFWAGKSLQDGIATLNDPDNAFRLIAEQGVKAARHHEGRLTDQIPLHEWITASLQRAVDKVTNDMQSGLSFLATAGSTAPFIGLFGTVWGIYHALIAIGIAGQASIDKVAGPVGEALIMTALGLAVAVPAVLGYNWLLRRNKALLEEVRYFATEVQQYLVSGARMDAPGQRSK